MKSSAGTCFIQLLVSPLYGKTRNDMPVFNTFLVEMGEFTFSPFIIETSKVLLVSTLWIGGLTTFVFLRDKYKKVSLNKS